MSYDQDYFPPKGTKYEWNPKALQHDGWFCIIWERWPASISAGVYKTEEGFLWVVRTIDWKHNREQFKGVEKEALAACRAAEKEGSVQKKRLFLPWMKKALAAGWRP